MVAGEYDNIFLMNGGWNKPRAVEPDHILHIVGIRPEMVGGVVGANCDIGVVANKAAAKPMAAVDGICCCL